MQKWVELHAKEKQNHVFDNKQWNRDGIRVRNSLQIFFLS